MLAGVGDELGPCGAAGLLLDVSAEAVELFGVLVAVRQRRVCRTHRRARARR